MEILRTASIEDLSALIGLEEISFPSDKISPRQLKYHITNPKSLLYVLQINDKIIGYLLAFVRNQHQSARLYSFSIHPDFRGQGFGKKLISCVIRKLDELGIKKITLEVDENDHNTINLYKKYNFKAFKKIPEYYKDGRNALKMKRIIENG